MTTPSLQSLAALPLALLAAALTGCPDTTENPDPGPVGKLTLVQTIVASDDPDVDSLWEFALSPDGQKLHASAWTGNLLTFARSPVDGALERVDAQPLFNAAGVAISADGAHLYASGNNKPWQIVRYDIDAATGEPVQKYTRPAIGRELSLAHGGSLLFESSGGDMGAGILSFLVNPTTGALVPGPTTPHASSLSNFVFLADDEAGSLYAERLTSEGGRFIVRYAVDAQTGALTKEAETVADLWWGYVQLSKCPGTTRLYVPQQAGNIGYADISGHGLSIPSSFAHPDLLHVHSAALSPDCKTLYAVTQANTNGSIVVLARDEAGDLSWLQTIPMGPGASIFSITSPWYVAVSPDGKNIYVDSTAGGEGLAVFKRDTTGAGF